MTIQTEAASNRIITTERMTTFFYSTLFIITQGAWVTFLVWVLLKIN